MLDVERWAELRREHFVRGVSIKELTAPDGVGAQHDPGGVAFTRCRRASACPSGRRSSTRSRTRSTSCCGADPEAAGCPGPGADRAVGVRRAGRGSWMTICARSARCFCCRGRFSALSIGRARSASSICGSHQRAGPGRSRPDASGLCRRRVPWATPGWAPARWCSGRRRRTCCGASRRCLWSFGALPGTLVWDREGACTLAAAARPTRWPGSAVS